MKTEKIIGGIVLVALIFKMLHWPGAGPMLVVSLSTLSIVYMAGGFYFLSGKTLKEQKVGLSIVTGIVLSMACIGILFRLMYWPGGKEMMRIPAFSLPLLIMLVFYFKGKMNPELENYYNNLLKRLILFAVVAVPLFFASNTDLLKIQYPNDPEMVRIKGNHFDHPENEAYAKEYQEYLKAKAERR